MSGFFLSVPSPDVRASVVQQQENIRRAAFAKKGMRLTLTQNANGYVLDLFANRSHDPAQALTRDASGRFCTYVGTLIYRGRANSEATAEILKDIEGGQLDCLDAAIGNYCLLIGDERGLQVVTDRAGLHHVYHTTDFSLVSNSFIATAGILPQRTFQTQEILEYVLLGSTFGAKTMLHEIELLDAENIIHVRDDSVRTILRASVWTADASRRETIPERLAQVLETADQYYSQLTRTYGDRVTAALSGGYDSRLSLAFLQRQYITPALFVYGADTDLDVQIAKSIGRGENLELSHLDRGSRAIMGPEAYWQNQQDVFHGLDGLTQYGFACEPYEVSHRRERVDGGQITVNGGGGEIWRDFWKLPDRPMSAEEFSRAYFSGRFDGLRSTISSPREFLSALGQKIGEIAGVKSGRMSPSAVQSLYARLRLRFWQGKNNSVDNFFGYAVTPFSEHHFSVPAMWIPLKAKQNDWFERQLIQRTSPNLARYPSSHGYSLEGGPNLFQIAKASITRGLPAWIRGRRRQQRIRHERSYYHSERFVHARFGAPPLEVERYFQLSRLTDALAFSRALTVERMLRGDWL